MCTEPASRSKTRTSAIVSQPSAFLYGLGQQNGDVQLDASQRLGIFTQPAVIASHSGPITTRLVKRGVFFTRKVMCLPLGVPPEDIDTSVPEDAGDTERERIESVTTPARCAGCHLESSATAQQPYFASSNIDVAFEAVKSRVDLNDAAFSNPALRAKSRLVVRLRDEFHNCWSASCGADAAAMQAAIRSLALSIAPRVLPMPANRSAGQLLEDGVIGSSGGRFHVAQIVVLAHTRGDLDPRSIGEAPRFTVD